MSTRSALLYGRKFSAISTTQCTKLTGLAESGGKEDSATQPLPLQAARGAGGDHVPKAKRLKRRRWGPRLCNKEGSKGG